MKEKKKMNEERINAPMRVNAYYEDLVMAMGMMIGHLFYQFMLSEENKAKFSEALLIHKFGEGEEE